MRVRFPLQPTMAAHSRRVQIRLLLNIVSGLLREAPEELSATNNSTCCSVVRLTHIYCANMREMIKTTHSEHTWRLVVMRYSSGLLETCLQLSMDWRAATRILIQQQAPLHNNPQPAGPLVYTASHVISVSLHFLLR